VLRRRLPDPVALERRLERSGEALRAAARARFALARSELEARAAAMQAFSPLGVLARGYALVQKEDGRIVREATELERGESLRIRLARGEARVAVEETDGREETS